MIHIEEVTLRKPRVDHGLESCEIGLDTMIPLPFFQSFSKWLSSY